MPTAQTRCFGRIYDDFSGPDHSDMKSRLEVVVPIRFHLPREQTENPEKSEIPGPELDRKLNAFFFSGQFNKKIVFPLYIAPGRAEYRNSKQIQNSNFQMFKTRKATAPAMNMITDYTIMQE